ncbi:hypothetical protein [Enterobacter ludwigii]|uniref:hypothetical protein n=1 Tax=Enterobacter ludwigii TaxID=299767 RepID=UPI000415FC9A|nr:hypothetical protein [Enterobacter ludwigii]
MKLTAVSTLPASTATLYAWSAIALQLRRERITDQPFSFVLTAEAGRVSMEYVTDEDPPRVLNRENCRGSLREFARY